jgi:hypothetical protein
MAVTVDNPEDSFAHPAQALALSAVRYDVYQRTGQRERAALGGVEGQTSMDGGGVVARHPEGAGQREGVHSG